MDRCTSIRQLEHFAQCSFCRNIGEVAVTRRVDNLTVCCARRTRTRSHLVEGRIAVARRNEAARRSSASGRSRSRCGSLTMIGRLDSVCGQIGTNANPGIARLPGSARPMKARSGRSRGRPATIRPWPASHRRTRRVHVRGTNSIQPTTDPFSRRVVEGERRERDHAPRCTFGRSMVRSSIVWAGPARNLGP